MTPAGAVALIAVGGLGVKGDAPGAGAGATLQPR